METQHILILVILLNAGIAGTLLFITLHHAIVQYGRSRRVASTAGTNSGIVVRLMHTGIPGLHRLMEGLCHIPAIDRYCMRLGEAARYVGFATDAQRAGSIVAALVLIVGGAGWLVSGAVVCGAALAVCVVLASGAWAARQCDMRHIQLREAIPEALQSMKACFQVGYTLSQTIREVRQSTTGPLSDLFGEVEGVLETGGGITDALAVLKGQVHEPELVFLGTALEIQHRTGSSMQQVLEATRQSVVDEIELKRTLKTQTAQAKLSAQIVTVMPFALVGVFSLVSPGFLNPFFESFVGIALLLVALGMQVAGVCLVRRMLHVEVV